MVSNPGPAFNNADLQMAINPGDIKEITDSYDAGSNSFGLNTNVFGSTWDGTYFIKTVSAVKEWFMKVMRV